MKKSWLLIGVGVGMLTVLLFILSVLVVYVLLGGENTLVHGSGVGLVEVKGIILDPQTTVKQLRDFQKNDQVKAIVLRVDSPGGVVGPSQEIYSEVKKIASKKKIIVSMGSVAASGGYYIAAPATLIYANPGTITGSIGVLMKFSNLEGLMGKVGMKAFTLKTGKFKDIGSPARTMSGEEKAMLQGVIESSHSQFVKAVAEGRKLPVETVRSIADGRIFTGEQAQALKLVDRLGTLQDAVEEAGRQAGIKGEPEIIRAPGKKNPFLTMLMEETSSKIVGMISREDFLSLRYELEGGGR